MLTDGGDLLALISRLTGSRPSSSCCAVFSLPVLRSFGAISSRSALVSSGCAAPLRTNRAMPRLAQNPKAHSVNASADRIMLRWFPPKSPPSPRNSQGITIDTSSPEAVAPGIGPTFICVSPTLQPAISSAIWARWSGAMVCKATSRSCCATSVSSAPSGRFAPAWPSVPTAATPKPSATRPEAATLPVRDAVLVLAEAIVGQSRGALSRAKATILDKIPRPLLPHQFSVT